MDFVAWGCAVLAPFGGAVAEAGPTVWDIVKHPEFLRADELLSLAERSRVPAEDAMDDAGMFLPSGTSEELNRQLNARAAALMARDGAGQWPVCGG